MKYILLLSYFIFSCIFVRATCSHGNFSLSSNVSVGTNPQSVVIGDFNGDGFQDLASANSSSNTVSIRLGNGRGGFTGRTKVSVRVSVGTDEGTMCRKGEGEKVEPDRCAPCI